MRNLSSFTQFKCIGIGTKQLLSRPGVAIVVALFASLSGCNGTEEIEPDWHHSTDPTPIVSPDPDSSPSPTPSPSPTGSVDETPVTDLYTGPESVAKYVQKFIDDAKIQGVDVLGDMADPKLEIRIASLDSYGSSTIGLCETGGGRRRVTFDPDFWDSVSETQRELLAHHEFGHCVLFRAHRTTKLTSGAYASIMYPTIMSSSTYTGNYDYYQEELFNTSSLSALEVAGDASQVHVCDHVSEVQY